MSTRYDGPRHRHPNRLELPLAGNPSALRRFGGWAQPTAVASCLALGLITGLLHAEPIPIPNASFELPVTTYVDTRIDSWQKTPKPFWYVENQPGEWDQLVGLFLNPPSGDLRHIDNCDGTQAIWVFAVPEAGLFQDYDSVDWDDPAPAHAFNARFEVGRSYELTVGLLRGEAAMAEGTVLELSLYYRDAASNQVVVAATSVTNSPTLPTNITHFVDSQVRVPTVQVGDPWAGRNIGVRLLSKVAFDPSLWGGYWDVDNVRLASFGPPILSGATVTNGHFAFTLESEPGTRFEILGSADLALPSAEWIRVGFVTNETGRASFTAPAALSSHRFYRAKQAP